MNFVLGAYVHVDEHPNKASPCNDRPTPACPASKVVSCVANNTIPFMKLWEYFPAGIDLLRDIPPARYCHSLPALPQDAHEPSDP